ncbi:MAG: GNAT family N-acetyltransferase [Actinomycetota bacterium]|nr:GNAT family N-acetyltransferase [Actinomycetota bacterium]
MIETVRLLLRRWSPDDLDDFAAIMANDLVGKYSLSRGGIPRERSEEILANFIKHWDDRGFGPWAAIVKETRTLIGYIGLNTPFWFPAVMPAVEVGYRLHPSAWNQGYATEGAHEALRFGFADHGLDEIIAIYEPENVASGRVMEKIGMQFRMEAPDPADETATLRVYAITKEKWRAGS